MGTKLLLLAQSYFFTGWIDLRKAITDMFSSGDAKDLDNAANSLDNIRPYLHFQDAVGQVFNWIKWGIIKALYNLANGVEDLATHSLDFSKLLKDAGLKDWVQGYVLGAAAAVMIAVLVWIGIKMMLGKEKTPVQNIILQAVIATFLIFNLQPLTNWVVDQSSNVYKAEVSDGGTSSIPFDIIKGNTNDIAYLVYNNWPDFKTKDSGKIKTQSDEDYGHNGWDGKEGEKAFDRLSATNLASAITPDTVDSMEKTAEKLQKDHNWKTLKFKPKYLKYQLIDGGNKPTAVPIGKSSVPFSNSYSGGYQRYTVAFLPVVVSLIALTVAFLFITYVIIKSFLDLAIMQLLALFIFSTDLDSGAKTKAAINDMFTAALTIALQGFELAFYRIVVNFLTNADMGPILYCVGMLAATAMLWTGSQKTAKFFGVDTGAQKGWAMGAIALNQGAGLIQKGAGIAKGTTHLANKGLDATGTALTGLGAAHKAREDGKSWSNSLHKGYNAAHAKSQLKKDFLKNGGSRHQWNKASRNGLVPTTINEMADKMSSNNGLTEDEYNMLRKPNAEGEQYKDFAATHNQEVKKNGLRSAIDYAENLHNAPRENNKPVNLKDMGETKHKLNDALRNGKKIMNNPNATEQEQVKAAKDINNAAKDFRKAANINIPENSKLTTLRNMPKISQKETIPGTDSNKDIVTQGGTEKLNHVKEEGKQERINSSSTPQHIKTTDLRNMPKVSQKETVPGTDSKKDVVTQGNMEQINHIKENGKTLIHNEQQSISSTAPHTVSQPPETISKTVQGSGQKVNITENRGIQDVTITSNPSEVTKNVHRSSAEFTPASQITGSNTSAPTIESVLHSNKHYVKNLKQDITTEINKERTDHTINNGTKKPNLSDPNKLAPKPRKDK